MKIKNEFVYKQITKIKENKEFEHFGRVSYSTLSNYSLNLRFANSWIYSFSLYNQITRKVVEGHKSGNIKDTKTVKRR